MVSSTLMGLVQDGTAGSLIDAAALHADQTVLNDIQQADAVLAAELVQVLDQFHAPISLPSMAVGMPFSKWMVR